LAPVWREPRLISQGVNDLVFAWWGSEYAPPPPPREVQTRIVILGGGFAGVTTADTLEHLFGADPSVSFTLVSDTNALLFTPMLAEVAGSSVEATRGHSTETFFARAFLGGNYFCLRIVIALPVSAVAFSVG
jgi:hypothetical protein